MKRLLVASLATIAVAAPIAAADYRARLPEDETIYFLLPDRFDNADPSNDRGGLKGERLHTGFDPTDKGFYHGGDLKGVTAKLDYIEKLGATAVWVAPVFVNKPVQGPPGHESAGYHGYWITDFTHVDPHLGSDADFKALVDAAHARGMKVYMDIVVNHTADVIRYRECGDGAPCPYRSRADYPYTRKGGTAGIPINAGFAGDAVQTATNFAKLTRPDYAYTPYVPAAEDHAKTPAWLNDPIYYHNRGNSTFAGENSTTGDFFGLDDVMTENPRVVAGFIDIYGAWIDRFHVDGFRIDTARHVNPEFWQAFVPAMLKRAKAAGIPHFHIFGEVAVPDAAVLAEHTRVDRLPSVLDFAFRKAALDSVAGKAGTDVFASLFAADPLYEGGFATADALPTFVSNHDAGRFAWYVKQAFPQASDEEVMRRVILAHAMILTLRGVPTVYAGDEQGFVGKGEDQDAREDQFASRTPTYLDQRLLGTPATHATARFDESHPIYRAIADLARIRTATPALRRGTQIVRASGETSGLLAVSRFDPVTRREVLIAFNTSNVAIAANVQVETASRTFASLHGTCATATATATATAPGSVRITLAPLDYMICAAGAPE
ncbi:alpha-amylase family glycosyl hydrolase [Sphingomonas oryzagri]